MTQIETGHPELHRVEVRGATRAGFILRGALGAAAVYGAGAVAPFVSSALGAGTSGDIDILNFALTLEYLEADYYLHKARSVKLGGKAKALASLFGSQEQEHVDALIKTIKAAGGTPAKKPTFVFPVTNEASFLKLAYALENTGVGAYNGAGPSLKSKELLTAAGSIVQVEARHAAAVGLLTHRPITPNGGFDKALTKDKVLAAAGPLIKQ